MAKTICGSYKIHVGNYDWGCSVDYAILSLNEDTIDPCFHDPTHWKVCEKKMVMDRDSEEKELYEDTFPRIVTDIFPCDENGLMDELSKRRFCLKLAVGPGVGSPLACTTKLEIFLWSNPYELHFSYETEDLSLAIDPVYTAKTTDVDMFLKKTYKSSTGIVYDYAEYIPQEDNGTLFVWLHGLGEGQLEGSDAYLPLVGRKGKSMAEEEFQNMIGGARILVPQCPTYWMDHDGKQSNFYDASLNADGTSYYTASLEEFIDMYAEQMQAKRIVLAGCSNGGYMCLVLAISRPKRYDAIVPICEAVLDSTISDDMIERLKETPMYFVYSKDDPIVNPELHEIPTIQRLQKAGAKNLHVSVTDHVIDRSGLYKDEDGNPYRYMGHLSWIDYDNNTTDDGNGLTAWQWIANTINKQRYINLGG